MDGAHPGQLPNDLDAFWMPFTANRQFKVAPRLLVAAEGMHYTSHDGRRVLDGISGLWCCNAGHGRATIVEAIQRQAAELDFAPPFQMGHPKAFELASRIAALLPGDLARVFFTNSGSEAVDTALKIAIAYHRARGEGARTRLIGRERGYHGVGFGGISVGGIPANRKVFGALLPGVDHLPHTYDPAAAFTRGQSADGKEKAAELEHIVTLHDPSTIAAVIVEPLAASTGVLVPPVGYLEELRRICDRHGILLIFDEVITGFGRLGKSFAAERFGIVPDLVTMAKGLTNGTVPMGAVAAREPIYQAFMDAAPENAIELFHGYTYSGHPLAAAAGLATLDLYRDENLFERASGLEAYFEEAAHSLRSARHVVDIRNLGLVAGIELAPVPGKPGARGFAAFQQCYEEHGLLVRVTGDTLAVAPPLIVETRQIDEIFGIIGKVLNQLD
jgi:beta-alanine--pyruvate transaminase